MADYPLGGFVEHPDQPSAVALTSDQDPLAMPGQREETAAGSMGSDQLPSVSDGRMTSAERAGTPSLTTESQTSNLRDANDQFTSIIQGSRPPTPTLFNENQASLHAVPMELDDIDLAMDSLLAEVLGESSTTATPKNSQAYATHQDSLILKAPTPSMPVPSIPSSAGDQMDDSTEDDNCFSTALRKAKAEKRKESPTTSSRSDLFINNKTEKLVEGLVSATIDVELNQEPPVPVSDQSERPKETHTTPTTPTPAPAPAASQNTPLPRVVPPPVSPLPTVQQTPDDASCKRPAYVIDLTEEDDDNDNRKRTKLTNDDNGNHKRAQLTSQNLSIFGEGAQQTSQSRIDQHSRRKSASSRHKSKHYYGYAPVEKLSASRHRNEKQRIMWEKFGRNETFTRASSQPPRRSFEREQSKVRLETPRPKAHDQRDVSRPRDASRAPSVPFQSNHQKNHDSRSDRKAKNDTGLTNPLNGIQKERHRDKKSQAQEKARLETKSHPEPAYNKEYDKELKKMIMHTPIMAGEKAKEKFAAMKEAAVKKSLSGAAPGPQVGESNRSAATSTQTCSDRDMAIAMNDAELFKRFESKLPAKKTTQIISRKVLESARIENQYRQRLEKTQARVQSRGLLTEIGLESTAKKVHGHSGTAQPQRQLPRPGVLRPQWGNPHPDPEFDFPEEIDLLAPSPLRSTTNNRNATDRRPQPQRARQAPKYSQPSNTRQEDVYLPAAPAPERVGVPLDQLVRPSTTIFQYVVWETAKYLPDAGTAREAYARRIGEYPDMVLANRAACAKLNKSKKGLVSKNETWDKDTGMFAGVFTFDDYRVKYCWVLREEVDLGGGIFVEEEQVRRYTQLRYDVLSITLSPKQGIDLRPPKPDKHVLDCGGEESNDTKETNGEPEGPKNPIPDGEKACPPIERRDEENQNIDSEESTKADAHMDDLFGEGGEASNHELGARLPVTPISNGDNTAQTNPAADTNAETHPTVPNTQESEAMVIESDTDDDEDELSHHIRAMSVASTASTTDFASGLQVLDNLEVQTDYHGGYMSLDLAREAALDVFLKLARPRNARFEDNNYFREVVEPQVVDQVARLAGRAYDNEITFRNPGLGRFRWEFYQLTVRVATVELQGPLDLSGMVTSFSGTEWNKVGAEKGADNAGKVKGVPGENSDDKRLNGEQTDGQNGSGALTASNATQETVKGSNRTIGAPGNKGDDNKRVKGGERPINPDSYWDQRLAQREKEKEAQEKAKLAQAEGAEETGSQEQTQTHSQIDITAGSDANTPQDIQDDGNLWGSDEAMSEEE